ncbi:hypothetical protein MKX03_004358 [Papaver bracteatum]|nr:hypothetical protein MKX03_004358 [Papaver bracteatum]
MGKRKRMEEEGGGDGGRKRQAYGIHSPSKIRVSNLPDSFTDDQLMKTFSDFGLPVKRCFMVMEKGSNFHGGVGFVQFVKTEDAKLATELKNGAFAGGKKIAVELAKCRAPLKQRRLKTNKVNADDQGTAKALVPLDIVATKGKPSEKQRVARTVIFGGLTNADIAEEVICRAKEVEKVENVGSVMYPLPKQKLEQHALARDGCKMDAAAVLYTSVKSARVAVSKLHQQEIKGASVWARQLGGEAKCNEIKELFSSAGFVWNLSIPQAPDTGLSKGFAFITFTCKQDAENAIRKVNGQNFGDRPIAVDWAVPNKIYITGAKAVDSYKNGLQHREEEDETSNDNIEDVIGGRDRKSQQPQARDTATENSDVTLNYGPAEVVDFEKEYDIASKVCTNMITSEGKGNLDSIGEDSALPPSKELTTTMEKAAVRVKPKWPGMTEHTEHAKMEEQQRTVFIINLPFDTSSEDVKQRFSEFGDVQSFLPVLHKVTRRPTGTGFLKFSTAAEADAAVAAAQTTGDSEILLKGRQLTVFKAQHKKSAHDSKLDKAKSEHVDQRNLYLAKEGIILEGSPAAEDVSSYDMSKRHVLEKTKNIKLQSPNFHVSRTRLIVYNLPNAISQKQLKKIFVDAVLSRASKQTPVIQQIKFLNETKAAKATKNYSRRVAFIQFTEHQHALVALRVLNNNPETFGPERRPIIESALENIQTLKLRQRKLAYWSTEKPNKKMSSRLNSKSADAPELKSEDAEMVQKKRKFQGKINLEQLRKGKFPNKTKKRSKTGGDEGVDKLDVLVEQYRSKFSQHIVYKTAGEKQGSRQLKRWFS